MCHALHLLNITKMKKYYSTTDIFSEYFSTLENPTSYIQDIILNTYDNLKLRNYKFILADIYKHAYTLNLPVQKTFAEDEWFNVHINGGVCYRDLNGIYHDLTKPMSTLSSNLDNILFNDKIRIKHLPFECVLNAYEYAGLGYSSYNYFSNSRKSHEIKVTSKYSIDIDDSYPTKEEINVFIEDIHKYNVYPSILYTPNGFHIDFYTNIIYNTNENPQEVFKETATLLCRYVYKFFKKNIDFSCVQINRVSPMPFTFRIDNDNLYFLAPELDVIPRFNSAFTMHDFFDKLRLDNTLPIYNGVEWDKSNYCECINTDYIEPESKVYTYINNVIKKELIPVKEYSDVKEIGNNFVLKFLSKKEINVLDKKGAVVIHSIFRKDNHASLMLMKRNDEIVMFDYKFSNAENAETIFGIFANINDISYRQAIDYILKIEGFVFDKAPKVKPFRLSETTLQIMELLKPCFKKQDKFLLHACYLELMFMSRRVYKGNTDNWLPFSAIYSRMKAKVCVSSDRNIQNALEKIAKCDRQTIQNIQSLFKITKVLYIRNCSELNYDFHLGELKDDLPNALKFVPINDYREKLIKQMVKCVVIANESLHERQPRAIDIFTRYRSWGKIEEIIYTIYNNVIDIEAEQFVVPVFATPKIYKVFNRSHYIKKVFTERLQI